MVVLWLWYTEHILSIYSAYIESRWQVDGKLLVRSKIENNITHRMQKHSVGDICYTNYSLLVVYY